MSYLAQIKSNESKKKTNHLVQLIKNGDVMFTLNDGKELARLARESALIYGSGSGDSTMELINTKNFNRTTSKFLKKATFHTASQSTEEASRSLEKKHDATASRARLSLLYQRKKKMAAIPSQ